MAIKVLRSDLVVHRTVVERFLVEGYVANRVDHPAIVRVLDDGIADDGCPFLVMELLEGTSLDLHVRRGKKQRLPPLTEEEAGSVVETLAEVLVEAEASGVIHRDIKPMKSPSSTPSNFTSTPTTDASPVCAIDASGPPSSSATGRPGPAPTASVAATASARTVPKPVYEVLSEPGSERVSDANRARVFLNAGNYAAVRNLLDPKARAGRADAEEKAILRAACKGLKDFECLARVH